MRDQLAKSLSFLAVLLATAGTASAAVRLNEIYYSPEQPEQGRQFVELRSTTGGVESLDGMWILEIDGDPANAPTLNDNPGTILTAIDLTGFSTGPNGLFLWRDSTTVLDNSPAPGVQGPEPSGVLTLDLFPGRVDLGYEGDEDGGTKIFENDASNFLLVQGFTGALGDDLDTATNPEQGDGFFDITPWAQVLDAVSTKEVGDPGFLYAANIPGINGTSFEGGFGADVFSFDPVENIWAFYDSGTGEGNPANVGPFYGNDGGGFFGSSDAAFADGREINTAADSRFLYTTPGAENVSGVGGLFRGDTEQDGDVDAADIDLLYENLGVVGTRFDVALNFGAATQADVDALVQGDTGLGSEDLLNTEYGDADLDRQIGGSDFLAIQRGFGNDSGWALGDFDGNNTVDGQDLGTWESNYGFSGSAIASTTAIPEPGSVGLAFCLLLGCLTLYRGQNNQEFEFTFFFSSTE